MIPDWFKPGIAMKVINDQNAFGLKVGSVVVPSRLHPYDAGYCRINMGSFVAYISYRNLAPVDLPSVEELLG
jgi:hypothetical protein